MTNDLFTHGRSILFSIELAPGVEATVHDRSYRYNGVRKHSSGITVSNLPWDGRNRVNLTCSTDDATKHLRQWREMGYKVTTFRIIDANFPKREV